ncbi:MAG: hypothetical protein ACRC7O_12925, partial [Fimbriiglobus sp.]
RAWQLPGRDMLPPSSLPGSSAHRLSSAVVAVTPAVVLAAAAARVGSMPLAAGAGVAGLFALALSRAAEPAWRPPTSAVVILIYLTALTGLWAATGKSTDPFVLFARGLLLLTAVVLFVSHDLIRSGLGPRRRARKICRTLAVRTGWPEHVALYSMEPDIRDLRDAVQDDPSPAIGLLLHPRPEVRAAGFVALQGRPKWRAVDSMAVIAALRQTQDPDTRAVGVSALNTADDPAAVVELAELLRDPAAAVRAAAAEAVLNGGGRRWADVRLAVRDAMADPAFEDDGPIPGAAGRLPAIAASDLYTWAADAEPLAERAAQTLVQHYAALLRAGGQPELPHELGALATDTQTPPTLRVELVGLLRDFGFITPELLDRLTDSDQPGPVRLLAAEVLLAANPEHPDALDVLRGLGRQPNRDTALTIARILQTYLNLDMGLPAEGKVPRASKVAVEAARRVLMWATGGKPGVLKDPGVMSSRPLSAPTLSGLRGNLPRKPDRGPEQGPWGRR